MSTLKPDELDELISQFCVVEAYCLMPHSMVATDDAMKDFAVALEAELRKRWFAEPVAWKTANWPYGTTTHKHVGERWREEDGSVIALYTAPHEQEPT